MLSGFRDRWLPALVVSALGLLLSEVLSFNVATTAAVAARSPAAVPALILGAHALYFSLFVLAVDLVRRFRIRDWTSLVLLGGVHGLLLEGVLADRIFLPGPGPAVLGLALVNVAFPALCWHPLLGFLLPFVLFDRLCRGETRLGLGPFRPRPVAVVAVLALAWFCWSQAPWIAVRLPGGVPAALHLLWIVYPCALLLVLMRALLPAESREAPPLLRWWHYPVALIPCGLGFALRAVSLLAQGRVLPLIGLVVFLAAAAALLAARLATRRATPEPSIFDRAFPTAGRFETPAFLRLWAVVAATHVLASAGGRLLARPCAALCVLGAAAGILFAALFPLYALGCIAHDLVRRAGPGPGRSRQIP